MEADKTHYLFYDHRNRELIGLDLLGRDLTTSATVIFPFELNGKYAGNTYDLVLLINEHNNKVKVYYELAFMIKPPYFIKHVYSVYGAVNILLFYRRHQLVLNENMIPHPDDFDVLEPFFSAHRGEQFGAFYMIKLHRHILDNQVIRPNPDSVIDKAFSVVIRGKAYQAHVASASSRHCFLAFSGCGNSYVFTYYNIGEDEVLDVLGIDSWQGSWPETVESLVYVLIDYINERCDAVRVSTKFKIDGNKIHTPFGEFEIKQTKSGKWYIKGALQNILNMFHINDKSALKSIVNSVLGTKRRAGVFPELDSRDEVIELIKKIQNEQRN